MAARNLANMSPEELRDKISALKPAWAQEYILQLEAGAAEHKVYAGRLERVAVDLHQQLAAARQAVSGVTEIADHARAELRQEPPAPRVPGMTPPDGEYAVIRVVDGAANMTPVGDLSSQFEIRFADFYQVRYGDHESTGGMRVLVIEGDDQINVHPLSPTTVLVSRH